MANLFDISIRTKEAVKKDKPKKSKKSKSTYVRESTIKNLPQGVITKEGKISHLGTLYNPSVKSLCLDRIRNIYFVKRRGTILILANRIKDTEIQREYYTPLIKGGVVKGSVVKENNVNVFKIEYIKYPFDDKYYKF